MNNTKTIAIAATVMAVASLLWVMNTRSINNSLETGLQNEKLKSESLLSEKLLIERDMQKIKDQLLAAQGTNSDLDKIVSSTLAKLKNQEADYQRMKKENQSLAQVRKQRQELISLQSQLENELQALKISYADVESKNHDLNNSIALLEEKNRILQQDFNRAMFAAIDQTQVQAVKGNHEKLTVRARRTKKLVADFEVPAHLKQLSFRIVDAKGNVVSQNNKGTISSTMLPSDGSYTASSEDTANGNKAQKVHMVYTPTDKLASGVYTVEILNENLRVGSLKVKLN
jgi:hypothetical protein